MDKKIAITAHIMRDKREKIIILYVVGYKKAAATPPYSIISPVIFHMIVSNNPTHKGIINHGAYVTINPINIKIPATIATIPNSNINRVIVLFMLLVLRFIIPTLRFRWWGCMFKIG